VGFMSALILSWALGSVNRVAGFFAVVAAAG
jgi:hypothetical protein